MSPRMASWLAWSLWLLGVLISGLTVIFHFVNERSTLAISVFSMLGELTFLTVGLLIVTRRRGEISSAGFSLSGLWSSSRASWHWSMQFLPW